MIKKIIACLTICFIITGFLSPVFSDASALPQPNWSDPGISEIINISDLTGWMLNGGTYDVSTYTDSESFMNDYFAARTKTRLEGSDYVIKSSFGLDQQYYESDDSAYSHPLDVNRVISSSYREHTGYGRRFSSEVNKALLTSGNLYDTKIPLLNEIEFANFVNYNHDALRLYSEFFNNDNPSPIPNPDPDYLIYINKMNNLQDNGFFWKNYNLVQKNHSYTGGDNVSNVNYSLHTWFGCDSNGNFNSNSPSTISITNKSLSNYIFCTQNILNLYINYNGSNYTGYVDNINSVAVGQSEWGYPYYNFIITPRNGDYQYFTYNKTSPIFNNTVSVSYSGTLQQVFNYFSEKCRNINIYVDNELWALVSEPVVTPSITPEFPDAVGGEELPNTTWPISRPRAPYYTSIPGVLQAIEDAIAGDGKLDLDDLKPYLTDENGDPVPDPIFDPEPIPIPVPDPVNPDVVPGLPILPAIPPEMPGFNGVSVLAEIINFTNQSLPTSLIVTFWGIVFGIVILGLIKILHK